MPDLEIGPHTHTFTLEPIPTCSCGVTVPALIQQYEEELKKDETMLFLAGKLWAGLCAHFFTQEKEHLSYEDFCALGERLTFLQGARYDPARHNPTLEAEPGELITVQSQVGLAFIALAKESS